MTPQHAIAALMLSAICGAWAAGDADAGKALFAQCAACHTIDPGGPVMVGPVLRGVLGKPAATRDAGYAYSDALKNSGLVWDDATLDAWIKNPAGLVPGAKMEFVGLTSKGKRDNLVAYLKEALK